MAQSGSAVLYDTPFDETIAHLSRALDNTRIYYGDTDHLREMKARRKTADEIYSEARPSVVAKQPEKRISSAPRSWCMPWNPENWTLPRFPNRNIEDKVNNEKDRGADSLDRKIYRCIQIQSARKDIDYTGGPAY